MKRNIVGLILGFIIGTGVTASAQTPAQDGSQSHPYLITQTGGWNKPLKCAAQATFNISVDGSTPVAALGVTFSPNTDPADNATYPIVALFPQSQMPVAIRNVGVHKLDFIQPATTITLADGVTTYTYPAATYTEYVRTLSDTPTTIPPKDGGGWRKILGTLLSALRMAFMGGV